MTDLTVEAKSPGTINNALAGMSHAASSVKTAAGQAWHQAADTYASVAGSVKRGSVPYRRAALAGAAAMLAPVAAASSYRSSSDTYYNGGSNNGYQCNNQWYYSYVNAIDPQTNTTWSVSTPWRLSYPGILSRALQHAGFQTGVNVDSGSCGWAVADKVYKAAVELGWVETIPPTGSSPNDFNRTTMDRMVSAVHGTYPTLEICLATIIPIAVVLGAVGGILACAAGGRRETQVQDLELTDAEEKPSKQEETASTEDVVMAYPCASTPATL